MARKHGRSGRLYAAIASGGTPEPVVFLNQWSIDFSTDNQNVTAFGDSNMVYVSGLPDASGSFSGYFDSETAQMYTAAIDGVARGFYLYPDTADATYWTGTALFDFSVSGQVDGAVTVSGNWNAASAITKTQA